MRFKAGTVLLGPNDELIYLVINAYDEDKYLLYGLRPNGDIFSADKYFVNLYFKGRPLAEEK